MTTRVLPVLLVALAGCSPSDPMQQKYTHEKGMDPIVNADPPIDSAIVVDICEAKNYNDKSGVMNEGKTFAELAREGKRLWGSAKLPEARIKIIDEQEREEAQKKPLRITSGLALET